MTGGGTDQSDKESQAQGTGAGDLRVPLDAQIKRARGIFDGLDDAIGRTGGNNKLSWRIHRLVMTGDDLQGVGVVASCVKKACQQTVLGIEDDRVPTAVGVGRGGVLAQEIRQMLMKCSTVCQGHQLHPQTDPQNGFFGMLVQSPDQGQLEFLAAGMHELSLGMGRLAEAFHLRIASAGKDKAVAAGDVIGNTVRLLSQQDGQAASLDHRPAIAAG